MILLATIPHTGTMFMHKLFSDHGLSWAPLSSGKYADVLFTHLYPAAIGNIELFDGVIVSTLRDREKVEASWSADNIDWGDPLSEFFRAFDRIESDALIVNVDDEVRRDAQLAAVSIAIGVELRTDWTPVNARA